MIVVDASVIVTALAYDGDDAAYVALAELLDTELLTADARLAGASGIQGDIDLI